MYLGKKFRIRKTEEIIADIEEAASSRYASYIDRVFLADGDALVMPAESILEILRAVKRLLPQVKRVTSYGTAQDVLRKTDEELKLLYEDGLAMVYLGAESGDDEILKAVKKDMTADEMAEAGQKLKKSGILCSVTFISGLGGREENREICLIDTYTQNRHNRSVITGKANGYGGRPHHERANQRKRIRKQDL